MTEKQETTVRERDMLVLSKPGHCYLCGGRIGIYTWTDCNGQAHPWCIPSERPKWEAAAGV